MNMERLGLDRVRMTVSEMTRLLYFEPGGPKVLDRVLRIQALSPRRCGAFKDRLTRSGP